MVNYDFRHINLVFLMDFMEFFLNKNLEKIFLKVFSQGFITKNKNLLFEPNDTVFKSK